MSENFIKTRAGQLFLGSVCCYLLTFVLPFLGEKTGTKFFWEGIEILYKGKLRKQDYILFAAFYIPFVCFPLLIIAWWKQQGKTSTTGWISIGVLIIPQLIIGYEILQRLDTRTEVQYIGYVIWCIAAILLTAAMFYKKKVELPEQDLSKHLIEKDP